MTTTSSPTPNPEYSYNVAMFTIRALTNLHVGSGGENYGIIDNLIQRDAATGFPCIYSSSLKGALREYCRHYLEGGNTSMINHIFGNDKKDSEEVDNSEKATNNIAAGKYRFLQADLLTIPMRSSIKPYYNTTGKWQLENLNLTLASLKKKLNCKIDIDTVVKILRTHQGVNINGGIINSNEIEMEGVTISSWPVGVPNININLLNIGCDTLALNDETFVELVSDFNLPVIARNNLDDGRSSNLWYEQVLPRETTLFFLVLYPKNDNHFDKFKKSITSNPVQIGANASIGYGFCELKHVELQNI